MTGWHLSTIIAAMRVVVLVLVLVEVVLVVKSVFE